MSRSVYILGAGATYGASTINPSFKPPLLTDFKNLFNYGNMDEVRIAYTDLISCTGTGDDIERFFTILFAVEHIARRVEPNIVFPSLENRAKVINNLEGLLAVDFKLREYLASSEDVSNVKNIFQYFIDNPKAVPLGNPKNLMTFIERAIYEWCRQSIKSGYCLYHASLFKSLKPKDSVVTFNYDEICDITLYRLCCLNADSFSDLGLTNILLPDDAKSAVGVNFLKMHGAFNWFIHPNYYAGGGKIVYILAPGKSSEYLQQKLVEEDVHTAFPLILPYYLKEYTYNAHDIFRKHIEKLKSLLLDAEEVWLVGKSFRNSDSELNYLIQTSCEKHKKLLHVINPDINNSDFMEYHAKLFNAKISSEYATMRDFYVRHDK